MGEQATLEQGRIKCRCHCTIPTVPTQGEIPEEGGYRIGKKRLQYHTNMPQAGFKPGSKPATLLEFE